MASDVTPALAEHLAGNRGPDPADPDHRRPPEYGVVATLTAATLEVVLTFRAGRSYCCYEWGCHLGLSDRKRWDGLRRRLAATGVALPPRLELVLTCVVEDGAEFFDMARPDRSRRGWFAFAPSAAVRYQVTAVEPPDTA